MLEPGDCLNRFCSAPVVSTVRLMRFMQLARSTLKTPKAADGPRDKTGQMPAHSPALLLLVARRDRYASWSCTSSSHPHAHLHAQLGRICIRRPIGGCHRSIVIGARPHALEELVTRRYCWCSVRPAGRLPRSPPRRALHPLANTARGIVGRLVPGCRDRLVPHETTCAPALDTP